MAEKRRDVLDTSVVRPQVQDVDFRLDRIKLAPDIQKELDEGSRVLDVVGLVSTVQPLAAAPYQETKLSAKDKELLKGAPVWMCEDTVHILLLEVSSYHLLSAGVSSS